MTAPVANPSWSLKMRRVRLRIAALERELAEPDADGEVIREQIADLERELKRVRNEQVKAYVTDIPSMAAGSIYGAAMGRR